MSDMNKPLVIYHDNCTDGFGAAFAAWLKLGDDAEYLPMNYNDATAELNDKVRGREIYILDFSFSKLQTEYMFAYAERVVWLDHHKTAFEMWCPNHHLNKFIQTEIVTHSKPVSCRTLLDNNKSGALLAWEFFHPGKPVPDFIRHIDDRDRWQFKLEGSKELHAYLSSLKPWTFSQWATQLMYKFDRARDMMAFVSLEDEIEQGSAILRAQDANVQSMAKQARPCRIIIRTEPYGCTSEPGLAVNANLHQSELGHELANRSGTYGLVWYVAANGRVNCSLRSNGDYDVSEIAKAFGGGGHKNAAGFETDIGTLMGWLA